MNIIDNKTTQVLGEEKGTSKDVALNLLLAKRNVSSEVIALLKKAYPNFSIVDIEGDTKGRSLNMGEKALVGSMMIKEGNMEGLMTTLDSLMSEVVRANSALLNFVAMNTDIDVLVAETEEALDGMVSNAELALQSNAVGDDV